MKNFLKIEDFSKQEIDLIFKIINQVKLNYPFNPSKNEGLTAINFFAEPSTRTRFSFERAFYYLNIPVMTSADAFLSSSLKKGESLKDTFRTLSQYSDLIVFRHPDENWIDYAKYSRVPVINAGNGSGEHPTQALLDLYTIKAELGNFDNKKVLICGDLHYGRTVHSLIKLLEQNNCKIFTCPSSCQIDSVESFLSLPNSKYPQISIEDVPDFLSEVDVLYMTRTQTERFNGHYDFEIFKLNNKTINKLKEKSVILHPLPRNEEIAEEVDDDPRAAYHERQVKNGLYTRIALIKYLLEKR